MAAVDKLHLNYYECKEFIVWCVIHKPSLLNEMYDPLLSEEWCKDYMAKKPVASFNKSQDRYLYWVCPLYFIRAYLREQCGYKDNWFVRLFWKF